MNSDIESRIGAAFAARAGFINEADLGDPADLTGATLGHLPQRRVMAYAGIAAAAVVLTVGGALGVGFGHGSSHPGAPGGAEGGSSTASTVISTSAAAVASASDPGKSCGVTYIPGQTAAATATCANVTMIGNPSASAAATGAPSTVANPPDLGTPSTTISNDSRAAAATPSSSYPGMPTTGPSN